MGAKMKKVSALAILFMFAVMMMPVTVKAEELDTSAARQMSSATDFDINADGVITKYKGTQTSVVIPAKVGDVTVTAIAGTFMDNKAVTSVCIPDTVTTIGDKTFCGATALNKISYYAASTGMTAEEVKNTIEEANRNNDQTIKAEFGKYVQAAIGNEFYLVAEKSGCAYLSKNVSKIGEQVFYQSGVVSFLVDENNSNYMSVGEVGANQPEGVCGCLTTKDGTKLICLAPGARAGYDKNSTEYALPDTIVEITSYACAGLKDVQKIILPASMTTVDPYAFYQCNNLLNIEFGENSKVATIGTYAFANNSNLDVKLPKSVTSIDVFCFANIVNRTPDISESSITVLPEYCFYGCENLHTITMPATLLEIKSRAFEGDDNINEVIFLGDKLEMIGSGAFKNCPNLHKIEIPEGVKALENDTFSGCQNLNEIVLPDSLESIGDNAFANCNNIHKLVIPPNVTHISKDSFSGVTKTDGIDTSKNVYAQAIVSGKTIPKKNKKFTVGALKYKVTKSSPTSIEVAVVGVKSKKLTKAIIGDVVVYNGFTCKVTSIGSNAFKKCKKLKKVTIGANVAKIGKNAFSGDSKLGTITIKSKVLKSVGKSAIKGINKNAKIKVPKAKLSKYKKLFKKSTGYKSSMKIKK